MIRTIEFFEKEGDALIYEIELPKDIDVELLTIIFKEHSFTSDPEMVDVYPIKEIHKLALEKIIKEKINIKKYDCFLACSADPNNPNENNYPSPKAEVFDPKTSQRSIQFFEKIEGVDISDLEYGDDYGDSEIYDDTAIKEIKISGDTTTKYLQEIFYDIDFINKDSEMNGSYLIKEQHKKSLELIIKENIDLERYICFLTCYKR